jgi:hypothetical protein
MPGGVGGVEPRGSPLSRSMTHLRHSRDSRIVTLTLPCHAGGAAFTRQTPQASVMNDKRCYSVIYRGLLRQIEKTAIMFQRPSSGTRLV